MSNNKKIILGAILAGLWLTASFVAAAETPKLKYEFPCTPIAGGTCPEETATSPAAYIARFYQFALMIAGMLAFGMIIFGAIQYTVSAGNVSKQSDARDRIFQALWGVALLLGAYLILYTIDPGLVNLRDPKIEKIVPPPTAPTTWKEPTQYVWTIEGYTTKSGVYFQSFCPESYPVPKPDSFCEKSGKKPDIFYKCCGK